MRLSGGWEGSGVVVCVGDLGESRGCAKSKRCYRVESSEEITLSREALYTFCSPAQVGTVVG